MKQRSLLALFMLISCLSLAQKRRNGGKFLDTIFRMKEVQERWSYVEKCSDGKRQLSAIIYSLPTRNQPYYWIKVGEATEFSYVTHFHFFVYPKPLNIKYYDTVRDSAIDLDEWRKEKVPN